MMGVELTYDNDSFLTAIDNGLTFIALNHAEEPPSAPASLPTSPVVFVAVPGGESESPVLVPLQIKRVSIKIIAGANPNPPWPSRWCSSVLVKFKASWLLEKQFSNLPLVLAVPVGLRGTLVSYELKSDYFSRSALHKVEVDAKYKPQLENLCLVSLPPVEALDWDKHICVVACYAQGFDVIDSEQGLYSFAVPLSIPSYVTERPLENLRTQRIRLTLECRGAGTVADYHVTSHPMTEIISYEKKRVLLQESRGFSDKDLTCSFRVSSPTMDQVKSFCHELSFIRAVEEGLKLLSGPGVFSSQSQLLPTSPVLYAVVSHMDMIYSENMASDRALQLPALAPLKMTSLSLKVNAEPKPESLHIQFKGRWSVHCVKSGHTCPLILAIPVGYKGHLLRYEIRVPAYNPTILKAEEFTDRNEPLFQNLYLVALPWCEGGADVSIRFCYVQDVIQKQRGVFSFRIPLSVPYYVRQIAKTSSSKEKIRLILQCKDTGTIKECDVPSHHLMELISNEKMCVLLKESLQYSDKDLTCSFMVT